jgi:uncharacterized protein
MTKNLLLAIMLLCAFIYSCACGGIHYSASSGDIECIKKSIENGTSIDQKNDLGRTPVMIATYNQSAESVEYLCELGANLNLQDNNKCTALLYASYYNLVEIAEILLKYGADRNIPDRYGNKPIDYAKEYKYEKLIDLLQNESIE